MKFINKSIPRLTLIALFLANCSVLPEQTRPSNSSANEGSVTAFTHVHLVPMTAEIVLENQTVLIEESRITAIGLADEIAAGASALMGQAQEKLPLIHVRGLPYPLREGSLAEILREKELDLFR